MGNMRGGTLALNDITAIGHLFSVDDGHARSLDVVANSTPGSTVTLSTWSAKTSSVVPVVITTASSVTINQPLTAVSVSDGVAAVAGGVASGFKSVTAGTLSDGVASISGGVVSGLKAVTATTVSDGVASMSAGVATGFKQRH